MKIIVICNSKTGFTKRYADWIAEELNCNVLPYNDMPNTVINANDIVIFGSRVHAGKVEHLDKVKSRFGNQHNLIVFATGGTPASEVTTIEKIWKGNFTDTEMKLIPHFYIQSGVNYEKMGLVDRGIMKIAAGIMSIKKDKSDSEAGFEQAIQNSYDVSSREYIMPLVRFVRNNYNLG
jgi:menaquinone-dependent protoporphyrinogen IX oxidase